MKIAFDIGGVISKYPDVFRPLVNISSPSIEVFIITDMHDKDRVLEMLRINGFLVSPQNVFCSDFYAYGELCKSVLCKDLGIDILIDDFPGYLGCGKHVRLLAMPDPVEPYYHDNWKTDGSEGDFGRRKKMAWS